MLNVMALHHIPTLSIEAMIISVLNVLLMTAELNLLNQF
jgi:hypothetical protein